MDIEIYEASVVSLALSNFVCSPSQNANKHSEAYEVGKVCECVSRGLIYNQMTYFYEAYSPLGNTKRRILISLNR